MKNFQRRKRPDFSAYHVRKQAWQMKILKFYGQIEGDDKVYQEFATKLFNNTLDKKQLEQINELMVKNEKIRKAKFNKKRAEFLGIKVGKIINSTKTKN